MPLEITETTLNGVSVLSPIGRITLGEETAQLREKVKETLSNGNWLKLRWGWPNRVVLDLEKVSFIDSAGLGALVAAYISATNQGATIKLARVAKRTREIMGLTKLATVYEIHDSVEAAIKSFPLVEPAATSSDNTGRGE